MKNFISYLPIVVTVMSCTDADQAKFTGLGNKFKVEVYSGGVLIRSYLSTGKVKAEDQSDGYYFTDAQTGRLIEVSGDIIITEIR